MSVQDSELSSQEFHHWFKKPLGMALGKSIQDQLDKELPLLFGYHIVQLGCVDCKEWLQASPIHHQIFLTEDKTFPGAEGVTQYAHLPFSNDSIDVLVLPLVLEGSKNPAEIIAEAHRVLRPEGYLIVIGINRWGLWGLRRFFYRKEWPSRQQFYSSYKVQRWLTSVGYDVLRNEGFFYRPPINSSVVFNNLLFLEPAGRMIGSYPAGLYLILSRKSILSVTPIKPLISFKNIVVGKRYVQSPINQGIAR